MAAELPWYIDNNDLFNFARSGPREIGYDQNSVTIIAPAFPKGHLELSLFSH